MEALLASLVDTYGHRPDLVRTEFAAHLQREGVEMSDEAREAAVAAALARREEANANQ